MIIEELKNDSNISIRRVNSIKDLDIERDLSHIINNRDYDLCNRMLDKVKLYRVTER